MKSIENDHFSSSHHTLSRRDFLKISGFGLGAAALAPLWRRTRFFEFPDTPRLGRVAVGRTDLKASPDATSSTVKALYEDQVVVWQREVVGSNPYRYNQKYVETLEGYVWSADLQPVRNEPNEPLERLPETSLGAGSWVEVTVPYVELELANPPARAPWLRHSLEANLPPRLYYSQILWVDEIRRDSAGQIWYRVNEKYGFGDLFWAAASAFRPITAEEVAPIHPEVEGKKVVVDVSRQTLSCFENETEVYYCKVSTGAKFDASGNQVDKWATPVGSHPTWRKMISTHMVGGTTGGGYDLPGIGWTSLFVGSGIAIHSTYWHNDFGTPRSHGCVNARPPDAKWVFRWLQPVVPLDPGDVTVSMPGGTTVQVIES